ncbi:unnamed protein product [Cyclocybe aegerita]|uniref:Succinate dehydrogenase cytochrome b560 subunit, mitochondrial n=1 Tax=Cyclocybe aegerita TaxID=1973307 RepID=A0A8S0X5A5_CYCAE|nr:unnamed protein product [Cyclocybe aegerita]
MVVVLALFIFTDQGSGDGHGGEVGDYFEAELVGERKETFGVLPTCEELTCAEFDYFTRFPDAHRDLHHTFHCPDAHRYCLLITRAKMMLTRAVGLGPALRKVAFTPNLTRNQVMLRNIVGRRSIQVQSLPPSANLEILNKQRLNRPSSPHFTIYQPQLTWLGSIANRVTGAGLSVLLYSFSIAYLIAPGTFDSAHVVEVIAGLPESVKHAGKAILAAPFAFHSLNGLRHLGWDLVKFITVKGAYVSGYIVLGATAVSTVALTLWK